MKVTENARSAQAQLRGRHRQKNVPITYSEENRKENERHSEKSSASRGIKGGEGEIHRYWKCYWNTIKRRDGNWKMPKVTGNTKRKKAQLETYNPGRLHSEHAEIKGKETMILAEGRKMWRVLFKSSKRQAESNGFWLIMCNTRSLSWSVHVVKMYVTLALTASDRELWLCRVGRWDQVSSLACSPIYYALFGHPTLIY